MCTFPADRVERDHFLVQIEESEPIPLQRDSGDRLQLFGLLIFDLLI